MSVCTCVAGGGRFTENRINSKKSERGFLKFLIPEGDKYDFWTDRFFKIFKFELFFRFIVKKFGWN